MALVMLVAAYGGGLDFEVVEQFLGLAGVFAGDAVDALEDVKGAEGDVAQVADGRGDEVEAGGECPLILLGASIPGPQRRGTGGTLGAIWEGRRTVATLLRW